MERSKKIWDIGVFFGIFLAFFFTLPTTLTEGDSGEWTVIAKYGGTPHPSGYPLYAILCRLVVWAFPHFPVITSLALLSALCAALAASATFRTLQKLGISLFSSLITVPTVFLSAVVWRMGNLPEPFALNLLLAAWIFAIGVDFITTQSQEKKSSKAAFKMGLCFALGACNHHSLVWMLPFWWLLYSKPVFPLCKNALFGIFLGLIPLSYFWFAHYDHLPVTTFNTVYTFADFLHVFLRREYGTFQLTMRPNGSLWGVLQYFFTHLGPWFTWGFLLLTVGGLGSLLLRKSTPKILLSVWSLSWVGSGVVFFLMFRIRTDLFMPALIERFMALPVILLAWPLAVGMEELIGFAKKKWTKSIFLISLVALLGFHITRQLPIADRSKADFYESHLVNEFAMSRYAGNTIVSASDPENWGILYGRYLLGLGAENFRFAMLSYWTEERQRKFFLERWGWPESFIKLNREQVVEKLLEESGKVLVVDLPLHPRPKLFEHGFELGPGFVLVKEKDPLPTLEAILAMNQEVYATLNKSVSCQEQGYFSSWDQDLVGKYTQNLQALWEKCQLADRKDLQLQVEKLEASFCSQGFPEPISYAAPLAPDSGEGV